MKQITPEEAIARLPRFLSSLATAYPELDLMAGSVRQEILAYQRGDTTVIRGPVQYHEARVYLSWLAPAKAVK